MSLSSIIGSGGAALAQTQYAIAVTNANIANADDPSISRKTYQAVANTTTSALSEGQTLRVADSFLSKAVLTTGADNGRAAVVDSYMQSYDSALGTTTGGDDISSLLTKFQTALTAAQGTSPDNTAVLSALSGVTSALNSASSQIQSLRTQADQEVGSSIDTINGDLKTVASLNDQILRTTAAGGDVSDLEDQRDVALQSLSSLTGATSFTDSSNRTSVYIGGLQLVSQTGASTLSYSTASSIGANDTYPGQISGVMLNGKDITASLTSGKVGGLIGLRDTILPGEQSKLDALTSGLVAQVNTAANQGTAYPPPSTLTSAANVSAGDALSATGTARIAVLDSSGKVISTRDLDLSSYATVGDLATALNSIPGLSASVSGGKLTLNTTASGTGAAIGAMDSAVGSGAQDLSSYFGFNNLLTGSTAGTVGVTLTDASKLPLGELSSGAAPAAGDIGVASGDRSGANALLGALSAKTSFTAAGGLAAQTVSLSDYATHVVSSAATAISSASSDADNASSLYSSATSRLQNLTGVNLDEETDRLTQFQAQYQANAQLISIVRDLFSSLITMMNT